MSTVSTGAMNASAAAKAREAELSRRLEENAERASQAQEAARLREAQLDAELSDAQAKITALGRRADRAEVLARIETLLVVARSFAKNNALPYIPCVAKYTWPTLTPLLARVAGTRCCTHGAAV